MNKTLKRSLIACAITPFLSGIAAANESGWDHKASVYLWAAALDGTVGLGSVPDSSIELSFSDILDKLDLAFMGKYRAKKGPWAISTDLVYMRLGGSQKIPGGRFDFQVDEKILEVAGGYEIKPGLDILAGLRYVNVKTKFNSDVFVERNLSRSDNWVDPIVGVEYRTPLSDKWSFYGRGDIGGFGVGSDFSWQLSALFTYQMSETWSTTLGYRVIDIDYDNGKSGSARFKHDMSIAGPLLGFSASF